MLKWIVRLLDRALAVLGALIAAQFPLFVQAYSQRLAGHVDELHLYLNKMRQIASHSGKSLEEYIQKFIHASDSDFSAQGILMNESVQRWHDLSAHLRALIEATPLTRPWAFFSHVKWEIAKGTWSGFEPGIPLTLEGAVYALIGLGLGYGVFSFLKGAVVRLMPK